MTIVCDINDDNPDLLFICAGVRAIALVRELWHRGVSAEVVSIDIDGDTRFSR
jgi:hypothetical protein